MQENCHGSSAHLPASMPNNRLLRKLESCCLFSKPVFVTVTYIYIYIYIYIYMQCSSMQGLYAQLTGENICWIALCYANISGVAVFNASMLN